jgi:hypothetical protein
MTRVTAYIKGAGNRKLRRIFVTKDTVAGVCVKLNKGAKLVIFIYKKILIGR